MARDYSEFRNILRNLADSLPFMGEEPFPAARHGQWTRPAFLDDSFVRRILISWLLGRPVSKVAERAGCSERMVHSLLRGLIYAPEEELYDLFPKWVELGLVAAIDGPLLAQKPSHLNSARDFHPRYVAVFCLICHRLVGKVLIKDRKHDGNVLGPDDARWRSVEFVERVIEFGTLEFLQAHLMLHFELRSDPIAIENSEPPSFRDSSRVENGKIKGKRARSIRGKLSLSNRFSWENYVSQLTLHHLRQPRGGDQIAMLPIRNGKPMASQQARAMWLQMLEKTGAPPSLTML